MNKILLNENEAFSNLVIKEYNDNYAKGKTLLSMLSKLGCTVVNFDNWQTVEQHFMQDFPKATLEFNLQANGIEAEYLEAKAFHQRGGLSYVPMTAEQEEVIRETHRIYAATDKQIEAYQLINETVSNFNRLAELGLKMDFSEIYLTSRIFTYDRKMTINQRYLLNAISNLK